MSDPITVVMIDDHALMRDGLREILETHDDITVVAEAGDSDGAITAVEKHKPHVVLLDVEIPGADVSETVQRIKIVSPATEVIILSMYDGPHLLQRLLGLGIRGYLLKSVTSAELVAAVRHARVDDGQVSLSVSRRSLAQLPAAATNTLSPRELDVLRLAARAMSNAQIATRLYLTEATVKRHLANIFAKLGAVSRIDAVNKAVAAAMLPSPVNAESGSDPTPS